MGSIPTVGSYESRKLNPIKVRRVQEDQLLRPQEQRQRSEISGEEVGIEKILFLV